MSSRLRAFGCAAIIVILTVAWLGLLMSVRPFAAVSRSMDRFFGALPDKAEARQMYRNPDTQEVTHGENPVPGLTRVSQLWRSHPSDPKVLLVGNSQMYTTSLAPGEQRSSDPEKTYVDRLAEMMQPEHVFVYRLSAPGMSYSEALWLLEYVCQHEAMKPSAVVLQMNYQAFWSGGIRDSLLGMLADEPFRQRAQHIATSRAPFADEFKEALTRHSQTSAIAQAAAAAVSSDSESAYADTLESRLRSHLEQLATYSGRVVSNDDFVQMLYRARIYLLHLQPSSARSITGARLQKSRAAIQAIADLCREHDIELILFNAPVNPRTSLYRTSKDQQEYEGFVQSIASGYSLPFHDFEHAVPANMWGQLLNGPDPLHMGRNAHEMLSRLMFDSLNRDIGRN